MTISIACVFDWKDLDAVIAAGTGMSRTDLLILPELCDGGYKRLHAEQGVSESADEMQSVCAALSRDRRMTVIAGSMALPGDDGTLYNRSVVWSLGEQKASFDKVHLFKPLGDDQFFAPGTPREPVVISTSAGDIRLGVMICYDLRFPELVRRWFKSGVDLVVVPARWPRVRDDAWKTLLKARAIENQCFVVGVDSRDDEGGGSYAYGPDGTEMAALGPDLFSTDPPYLHFSINFEDIRRVKQRLDTRLDARLL
ncbi:MAG: hypothetical protein Kow0074_22890 [Candidatus Zixiibacteriota bacterium]